jgi:hypothetical protein
MGEPHDLVAFPGQAGEFFRHTAQNKKVPRNVSLSFRMSCTAFTYPQSFPSSVKIKIMSETNLHVNGYAFCSAEALLFLTILSCCPDNFLVFFVNSFLFRFDFLFNAFY